MANNNPSAKAGETDIIAARKEAAAKLQPLFVESKDDNGSPAPGVFHTFGIKKVVESSPDYAKYIDDLRANPHAKSLAIVAAARGNNNFPPALVAELFSRPGEAEEDNDWFARVYMGGLADIFSATGVGLMLPPNQAGLDLARGAFNVVSHLSDEERSKLGLCEADESPRRQLSADLFAMIEEKPAPLTPAQQLYRWAIRKWDARQERREVKTSVVSTSDVAAALPQAATPPKSPEPEAPKAPAIPDLSALTGGSGSPQPSVASTRASRANRKVAAVASATPAVVPPAPPANELKPATSAVVDEDQKLILDAIEAAGTPAAKAMLALVRANKRTVAEAAAWATSKGLL